MDRFLGIDYGSSKTGLSLSDPLKIIASDLTVLHKLDEDEKVQQIEQIVKENNISKIIIGLPLNMDGSHGFQADEVKEFAKKLEHLNVPIFYVDERLSTKEAEETMKQLKMSEADIRKKSDAKAASVILQQYLDYYC